MGEQRGLWEATCKVHKPVVDFGANRPPIEKFISWSLDDKARWATHNQPAL